MVSLCQIHLYRPLIIHISEASSADAPYHLFAFLIFFRRFSPASRPEIINGQKNTKLCRVYSHISSYKWVYFSITLSTFPVTLKLQQLRSCSSFAISKVAGHWLSPPICVPKIWNKEIDN